MPGPAQRLEDVEKIVRKLQTELAELQQWLFDCQDAIVTRVEALEDSESPRLVIRHRLDPLEHI